jgi:hypothetical protein
VDFWDVYEKEKAKPDFGKSRLYITSRERIGLSLSTVEKYGFVLGMNQGTVRRFTDEFRYILVKDLTHDILVSLYDVNTTHTFIIRFSDVLGDPVSRKFREGAIRLKKPNFEMRVIGAQDKEIGLLAAAERLHGVAKPALMEVDLFGNEARHIIFDTKLGMFFNLLLLNRVYRPHELANTLSLDDFNKTKSELKFV